MSTENVCQLRIKMSNEKDKKRTSTLKEILRLKNEGYCNKEIAQRVNIPESSIRSIFKN